MSQYDTYSSSPSAARSNDLMIDPVPRETKARVSELCATLNESTKLKKLGRCNKYTNFVNDTDQKIDRWKFSDWDYSKGILPVNARGLFTINDEEIIVRGYDKFFNVGELPITTRESLAKISGPYDVTLKENGCIIFIGATATELVVCSKNSTGTRDDLTKNHAKEGEIRLMKQLKEIGKSPHELASYLYKNNITAVAELCDDEFEEHVLPYPKDTAGLYLHGVNYNTVDFKTVDIDNVGSFASIWGFKMVKVLKFDEYNSLFQFLDDCAITGKYNNQEIEGFVIRCHNPDFFFKFKFEQPYLLYRQFREITRKIISEEMPIEEIPIKKNKYISRKYLVFARNYFDAKPELKKAFNDGHGIVELRQAFLKSLDEDNGVNLLNIDEELSKLDLDAEEKFIIVPVATIGCGKTTIFKTLTNLYKDWDHIQNDDISKSSKLRIVDRTLKSLKDHDFVLFDRNNSGAKERTQIFKDIEEKVQFYIKESTKVNIICVTFNMDNVWDITKKRVFDRGDNHQSIKSTEDPNLAIKIMKSFLGRYAPVNPKKYPDSEFDLIINLDLGENSSLSNTKKIIDAINKKYPQVKLPVPSETELLNAFKDALEYKPEYTKTFEKVVKRNPTFFAINADFEQIQTTVDKQLANHDQWQKLKELDRVQKKFHVTLAHVKSRKANKASWGALRDTLEADFTDKIIDWLKYYADIKLREVVIRKDYLICLRVEILKTYNADNVEETIKPLNEFLHITIGTFDPKIQPAESNTVLGSINPETDEIIPLPEIVLTHQQLFAHV